MIDARWVVVVAFSVVLGSGIAACGGESFSAGGELSGLVRVDGPSAVAPLTEAVAAEFEKESPKVDVVVGRRVAGGMIAIGVANQAIAVIASPGNPRYCLRLEHLRQIWRPKAPISRWSEIRDWNETFDARIRRYGPSPTSATFAYFTETVNGESGLQTESYGDAGKDEARTVQGVRGSKGSIGYIGLTSFEKSSQGVRVVAIESEESGLCVIPSSVAVQDGSYNPLGRELSIYLSNEALRDPAARAFVDYYLARAVAVAASVGLVPLGEDQLARSKRRVAAALR